MDGVYEERLQFSLVPSERHVGVLQCRYENRHEFRLCRAKRKEMLVAGTRAKQVTPERESFLGAWRQGFERPRTEVVRQ
jgi:hypothetical protein